MFVVDPAKTALLLVDMQNDFLHPKGAYGRAGQSCEAIAALPNKLVPVADAMRAAGSCIISTHFTLVPGKGDEPIISSHLKSLRPFLGKGDFAPGAFGHQLIDELQPADFTVEKVAFSAFFQSRMVWILNHLSLEMLIFAGIVTNGGVASTLRDAHVRDFDSIVLSDGCAAFDNHVHDATIKSLSTIAKVATCQQIIDILKR